MNNIGPPAPRPCVSCPYRQDVPSGVWAETEYELLPKYDRPTIEQPPGVFLCHQNDKDATQLRICGGWAGCHDGDELMALRLAGAMREMTIEAIEATRAYVSPVPLFQSGADAAEHGMAMINRPGEDALKMRRDRRALVSRQG
jgi:hypothetical protein